MGLRAKDLDWATKEKLLDQLEKQVGYSAFQNAVDRYGRDGVLDHLLEAAAQPGTKRLPPKRWLAPIRAFKFPFFGLVFAFSGFEGGWLAFFLGLAWGGVVTAAYEQGTLTGLLVVLYLAGFCYYLFKSYD